MADESSALSEAENRFFETGGEAAPEETAEQPEQPEVPAEGEDGEASEEEAKAERERMVPHAALHEERMRRKELNEELASYRDRVAKMEERFAQIQQSLQARQQEPEPSFEDDPAAYLRYQQERYGQELQKLQEQNERVAQGQQQQAQFQQFYGQYQSAARDYASKTPDFPQAYQHLMKARMDELQALGFDAAQADRVIKEDEYNIAMKAFQDGVNPAERLYEVAKRRGYRPSQGDSGAETVERIERGQKASRSPSGGRGKAAPPMTAEALMGMSDEEFEKNWEKIIGSYS